MSARIKQNRELTLLATLVAVTAAAWKGYVVHKDGNEKLEFEDIYTGHRGSAVLEVPVT